MAVPRFENYKNQPLQFTFPKNFNGKKPVIDSSKKRIKAAIIREKGSNSEREMANAMYLAGFDVKDVHMTDLITGRETLDDIKFIAAVGRVFTSLVTTAGHVTVQNACGSRIECLNGFYNRRRVEHFDVNRTAGHAFHIGNILGCKFPRYCFWCVMGLDAQFGFRMPTGKCC